MNLNEAFFIHSGKAAHIGSAFFPFRLIKTERRFILSTRGNDLGCGPALDSGRGAEIEASLIRITKGCFRMPGGLSMVLVSVKDGLAVDILK